MTDDREAYKFGRQFRILAILWFLYGVLMIVEAVVMLSVSATATLMFGALLNRVADPFTLMNIFHVLYASAIVFSAACGVLGVLAGWALLSSERSSRALAIIAAVCALSNIPVGTTLGIYTLILLISVPVRNNSVAYPATSASVLKHHETPAA